MRNVSQGCTSTADIKAFIVPSIIGIGKIGLIFRNGLIHINGICWVLAIGFWLLQRLMCENFLSTQKVLILCNHTNLRTFCGIFSNIYADGKGIL